MIVGLTRDGKLYHRVLPPSGGHFLNFTHTACHFGWFVAREVDIHLGDHKGRCCTKCWPYAVRRGDDWQSTKPVSA